MRRRTWELSEGDCEFGESWQFAAASVLYIVNYTVYIPYTICLFLLKLPFAEHLLFSKTDLTLPCGRR